MGRSFWYVTPRWHYGEYSSVIDASNKHFRRNISLSVYLTVVLNIRSLLALKHVDKRLWYIILSRHLSQFV